MITSKVAVPRKANIVPEDSLKSMTETHLSRETHERLSSELHELTTVGRTKIAQAIEAARNLGDLSENGDYHAAKDEQGRMEGRIRQLTAMLENAQILDDSGPSDAVMPGSTVSLRYEGDDAVEPYYLGSIEERREGIEIVSTSSPLGRALLGGAKKGDTVSYETPTGAKIRVEIVDVTR
jgi:transcription elongation factor GreA